MITYEFGDVVALFRTEDDALLYHDFIMAMNAVQVEKNILTAHLN